MKKAILLFFFLPFGLFGQDLTGTWIGTGGSGAQYLKLVIIQKGDSCYGYTYDEGPGYCKANFAGKFDNKKQKLKGKGTGFIDKSIGHSLAAYDLDYSINKGSEYLDGTLGPKNAGLLTLSLGIASYAQLKKTTRHVDTTEFMWDKTVAIENITKPVDSLLSIGQKKATTETDEKVAERKQGIPPLPDPILSEKQGRLSAIIETIITNVDTIQITIYDNGVVDDDTVTVFLDNEVILDRFRITDKGKELYIPLAKNGQSHILELFANNLGSIPPNTALIIIMAGKQRYEVRASYDLSTNAKIIFQYKE